MFTYYLLHKDNHYILYSKITNAKKCKNIKKILKN